MQRQEDVKKMAITKAAYEAQKRYDEKTSKRINLKLHKELDNDIIQRLRNEESMQGYIKRLIREDIKRCDNI